MAIDQESIRWASEVEVDPVTGLPNRTTVPSSVKNTGIQREEPLTRQWLNNQFYSMYTAMTTMQSQIDDIVVQQITVAMEALYPIGAVFISFVEDDPATLLGVGVWEAIEGQFLVGAGGADPLFTNVGTTGGNTSHSHTDDFSVVEHELTPAEIPPHSHDILLGDTGINTASEGDCYTPTGVQNNTVVSSTFGGGDAHNHNLSGGVQSSSNLPPYISAYMFKRVS